MTNSTNRRRFERFCLPVQYTAVRVRLPRQSSFGLEGHAYDICEGGAQFELDFPIAAGTAIEMEILLPTAVPFAGKTKFSDTETSVRVSGNVIWTDTYEPGPARMAIAFTKFADPADRDALIDTFSSGRLARAA